MEANAHFMLAVPIISKPRQRSLLKTASSVKYAGKGPALLHWLKNRGRLIKRSRRCARVEHVFGAHDRIAACPSQYLNYESGVQHDSAGAVAQACCESEELLAGHPDDRIGMSAIRENAAIKKQ